MSGPLQEARKEIEMRQGTDVMRRDVASKAPLGSCVYCGRGAVGFYSVPEPTEHSTYAEAWRVLCGGCWVTYRDVPYGFSLER